MYIIGVGTNEKVSSKLIRAATRGWCSHAWLELHQRNMEPMVLHSEPSNGGVHWEPAQAVWDRYPRMSRYVTRRDLAPGIEAVTTQAVFPYVLNCAALVATVLRESGDERAAQLGTVVTPNQLDCYLDGIIL
jgi:hypothetical protein